jgi:hypothetical protein
MLSYKGRCASAIAVKLASDALVCISRGRTLGGFMEHFKERVRSRNHSVFGKGRRRKTVRYVLPSFVCIYTAKTVAILHGSVAPVCAKVAKQCATSLIMLPISFIVHRGHVQIMGSYNGVKIMLARAMIRE